MTRPVYGYGGTERASEHMDKTYPSKVDWWLGLILLGIAACVPVCIVAGIMALGSDMGAAITLFVTAVL